jgi:hypothetical protein
VGRERLFEVVGDDLSIPTEPYRFVRVDVFAGTRTPGRTSRGAT